MSKLLSFADTCAATKLHIHNISEVKNIFTQQFEFCCPYYVTLYHDLVSIGNSRQPALDVSNGANSWSSPSPRPAYDSLPGRPTHTSRVYAKVKTPCPPLFLKLEP